MSVKSTSIKIYFIQEYNRFEEAQYSSYGILATEAVAIEKAKEYIKRKNFVSDTYNYIRVVAVPVCQENLPDDLNLSSLLGDEVWASITDPY